VVGLDRSPRGLVLVTVKTGVVVVVLILGLALVDGWWATGIQDDL
jgi:hypothetical protein